MSLNSVNTNIGAMVALENLSSTQTQLQSAQNQISTGLKIASAKDDGSTWAIAQNQRAQVLSLDAVKQSLSRGQSAMDVAISAGTMVGTLQTALDNVSAGLAKLGTGSNALSTHMTFVSSLQDSLNSGISNLVDADLAKESATLQALQTKQQLGVQALSIANSSTSVLLSLFR